MALKFAKNIKFRTRDRKVPELCSTGQEGTGNNPAWYKKLDSLFKLATQVSQYHTKGMVHKLSPIEGSNQSNYYAPDDLFCVNPEGITVITVEPSAGELIDANSPLNKAMLNFFNAVRGKYVSSVPFQANDLGVYMVAVGSVITIASHIKKCLEIINLYEPDSILTPLVMFSALGLDYKQEAQYYAENVMNFDLAIRRLSSLTIPQSVTYFEKCAWQCRYVYREDNGPNSRSDLYTMVPNTALTWSNEVDSIDQKELVQASGLIAVPFTGGSIGYMIRFLNVLIDRLVNDDNVRNISGWLRQYLPDNVQFMNDVVERGFEVPAYSEEFKWQIINARVGYSRLYGDKRIEIPGIGDGFVYAAQNIGKQILEDITSIDYDTETESGLALFTNDIIMNHHKEMSQDEVMEYTRYAPLVIKTGPNNYKYAGDTFYITGISKYYNTYENGISADNVGGVGWSQFVSDANGAADLVYTANLKATSHMYPVVYIVGLDEDHTLNGKYAYVYDSKFSFKLSGDNLRKLHQIAVLSEFHTDYPNKI